MRSLMTKILEFPDGKKGKKHEGDDSGLRLTKEFCGTCGGSLDLWTGNDGVAYGLCNRCDFSIGQYPIVGLENLED